MNFFNDYAKLNPEPKPAAAPAGASNVNSLTVDDMKAYFDQMKADLIKELKVSTQSAEDSGAKELKTALGTIHYSTTPIKEGGNENASSTDLSSSKSNSSESAVDR